jgi:hypothetical protein
MKMQHQIFSEMGMDIVFKLFMKRDLFTGLTFICVNLYGTEALNPNMATDGQGSFPSKWPFLHLLISCLLFHTFLHINTSGEKCIL